MAKAKITIKNCWRCDEKAIVVHSSGENTYCVICTKCGAEGLEMVGKNAKILAIEWWNTRAEDKGEIEE